MNETLNTIYARRSVRKFKPNTVEKEKIEQIVKAGTYAATGRNRQSPVIIAVTNRELRDKIAAKNAEIMGKEPTFDPFYGAPVILIVLADKRVPTYLYDGTLVLGNMMLAAKSLGLDTCWIHRAKEEFEGELGKEILQKAGIDGEFEGIGHLALGYCEANEQEASPRKENYVYYID